MNNAENIRVYTINENGNVEIDMNALSWKCRQTRRAADISIIGQAKNETTETLRRVVKECAGTRLAQIAAKELARRVA